LAWPARRHWSAERVAAELDILGFDVSQHVLEFYAELPAGLGVIRSPGLARCRPGETVLVAFWPASPGSSGDTSSADD
jgi:hypothetical protein